MLEGYQGMGIRVLLPAHIYETVEVLGYVVKVQFRHFGREVIDGYHGPHCICRFEFLFARLGECCEELQVTLRY
jgi:hypothetical protein